MGKRGFEKRFLFYDATFKRRLCQVKKRKNHLRRQREKRVSRFSVGGEANKKIRRKLNEETTRTKHFSTFSFLDRLMAFMMTDGCYPKRSKTKIIIYELLDQIVEREREKQGNEAREFFRKVEKREIKMLKHSKRINLTCKRSEGREENVNGRN